MSRPLNKFQKPLQMSVNRPYATSGPAGTRGDAALREKLTEGTQGFSDLKNTATESLLTGPNRTSGEQM